jgi:hypothetical protein
MLSFGHYLSAEYHVQMLLFGRQRDVTLWEAMQASAETLVYM